MNEELPTPSTEPVETTGALYTDFETASGVIRILHEVSLGDLIVATMIALLLLFLILSTLMKIVWRR
jgi:hypothetical protein